MTERVCRIYSPEQFDLVADGTLATLLADYNCLEIDGRPDLRGHGGRPLEGPDVLRVRAHPDDSGQVLVAAEVAIDLPEMIAQAGGISVREAESVLLRHLPEVRAHLLSSYGAELTSVRDGCLRFWITARSGLCVTTLVRDIANMSLLACLWEQGGAGSLGISRAVGAGVLDFVERQFTDERGFLAHARYRQQPVAPAPRGAPVGPIRPRAGRGSSHSPRGGRGGEPVAGRR